MKRRLATLSLLLFFFDGPGVGGATSQSLSVKSVGSVERNGLGQQVSVVFSQPVEDASAVAANFSLRTGTITGARLVTGLPKAEAVGIAENPPPNGRILDNMCVLLSAAGLVAGADNVLTVKNVKERGNAASAITSVAVPFKASGYKWTETGQLGMPAGRGKTPGQVIAIGDDGFDIFSNGGTQWANYDETTIVYKEVTGDFDVKARLEFQDVSSRWGRAGLMVREDLNEGMANPATTTEETTASRYASMHANPVRAFSDTGPGLVPGNNGFESHFRADVGGQTSSQGGGVPSYPNVWLRLQRAADTLFTFRSEDAQNWEMIAERDVTGWNKKLFVGPSFSPETQDGNINPANGAEVKSRLFLIQIRFSPPAAPYLLSAKPAVGAVDVALDADLELNVADGATPVKATSIKLTFDGNAVTPAVTKAGSVTTVKYKPAAPFEPGSRHAGTLSMEDTGTPSITVNIPFSFTASLAVAGTLFIEAEDFNYDGGSYVTGKSIGMTGKYVGGDYQDLGAVEGIDYNEVSDNNEQPVYRGATGAEAGKRGDSLAPGADGLSRGSFDVEVNHVLGWNDAGDWFNYTRVFPTPAKVYKVYARLASGGIDEHGRLDLVTGGARTAKQTLQFLGTFDSPPTGNWDTFHFVPLRDAAGNEALVKLSGEQTLRFTVLPGNLDINYLMFVPVAAAGLPPAISSISPPAAGIGLGDDPVSIAILNRDTSVALNSIKLSVNGVDVTRAAAIAAATAGASVKYQPATGFAAASTVKVKLEYTDTSTPPVSQTSEWSYDVSVLTRDTLFIEAEDFNFGHGNYVTDQPVGITGKYPGGSYQNKGNGIGGTRGDGSDFGIDYFETNPGSEQAVYRPNTGVEAGKRGDAAAPPLAGLYRGAFDVEVNHVLGWNDAGDWYNYTRAFPTPARDYIVYARLASGGNPEAAQLDEVTAGAPTSSQALGRIGTFNSPASGGWDTFHFVPLQNSVGAIATVNLGGVRTLRFTTLPGNLDIDYLAFIPVGKAPASGVKFSSIRREGSNVIIEWTGTATLQAADDVTGPWVDVPASISPKAIAISGQKKFYRFKP